MIVRMRTTDEEGPPGSKGMPSPWVFLLAAFWLSTSASAERRHILMLCIDDLRPDLGCYGADHIQSPNIDKLAASGRLFERHYVQSPTCGASRYSLLTGTYDRRQRGNDALFQRAATLADPPARPSLPRHFRDNGYTTVSIGKVSHHPGGLGGANWDDASKVEMPGAWSLSLMPAGPWKHPRGAMHGLARGETRGKAGPMDVFQSVTGPDDIYPDGWITEVALDRLDRLAESGEPFLLAIGWIRPHLPFGAPEDYFDLYEGKPLPPILHPQKPTGLSTWHKSGELHQYNLRGRKPNSDAEFASDLRRHYAACVSYVDAQVGRVLERLSSLGLAERTVIVLWGDHGWHLGEHAVWGKHTLFEESLRSPLIVRPPCLTLPGKSTAAVVETVDLYPTLCALAGLAIPSWLDGRDLAPLLADPTAPGRSAVSYYGGNRSIRCDSHRLIAHRNGGIELYDHRTPAGESRNVADAQAGIVALLLRELDARLPAKVAPGGGR